MGFAAFEYGLWGTGIGFGAPMGYEGSLSRLMPLQSSRQLPLLLSATHGN